MPKAVAKKEKKQKKVKDPNAPKGACGPYMWFCKEMRDDIKTENPDWAVTQIGKRLGEMWKATSEDDKKKFFEMAEEDKIRHKKDMAAYKGDA
jgi:hypothetical protein